MVKVVLLIIGSILVFINFGTLLDICRFYLGAGNIKPEMKILRTRNSRIFSVIFLTIGIAMIFYAILPHIDAERVAELPTTLFDAVSYFAPAGFMEEALFRIIPFMIMLALREKFRHSEKVEKANIAVAIITTAIFAALHITNYANPDIWAYVWTIPLFFKSLPDWYLVERDGLLASTITHVSYNCIMWSIYTLFL